MLFKKVTPLGKAEVEVTTTLGLVTKVIMFSSLLPVKIYVLGSLPSFIIPPPTISNVRAEGTHS